LDLMCDLLVAQHALSASHLLDLEAHRRGVLEDHRHDVAQRDPAALLHRDDLRPKRLALALVLAQIFDVVVGELAHWAYPASRPYARASTWIGWSGCLP